MPEFLPDDNELMRRLADGQEAALRLLIHRWQAPLLSFAYRYLQDRGIAHDVTQETFIRVYQARHRYRDGARFSSWMFKIAANLCRNQQRWMRRHPSEPLEPESTGEGRRSLPVALWEHDDPADAAERADLAAAVAAAVQTLPHAQKVTLILYYYENLSYKEIARVLCCTERGVETRLYRARKALSELWLDRTQAETTSAQALAPVSPPAGC